MQKKIIFFTIWLFVGSWIAFIIYKLGIYDPFSQLAKDAYFDVQNHHESIVWRYVFIYLLYNLLFSWLVFHLLPKDTEKEEEFDSSDDYFQYISLLFIIVIFVFSFTATMILIHAALGLPHKISLEFFLKRIDHYFFFASIIFIFISLFSFLFCKNTPQK